LAETVTNKKISIAVLGAGRLGTTLAYCIAVKKNSNIKIAAIASPSKTSIERAKEILGDKAGNILFTSDNSRAAETADTIFICTPDDMIGQVCRELYRKKTGPVKTVIHFSGSKPLSVLETAREKGDYAVSIHPLKSFASIKEAAKTLKGTEYGITYDSGEGEKTARAIVGLLEGNTIFVKDEAKPVYHAAACIASNYLVTLIDYAVTINERIGIEPGASTRGLLSLVEGTVKNIKKMGTKRSLTGPIARGDAGTIEDHLTVLDDMLDQKDTEIYKIMGKKTADLALENKWIDKKTHNRLQELLNQKEKTGKEDQWKQKK
jgi:predicted short-subunit dehydrogenase-like oxidoreductase (DUF2520 family)